MGGCVARTEPDEKPLVENVFNFIIHRRRGRVVPVGIHDVPGEIMNDDTVRVVPVEVYSRVVGYFRPVNQWNKGKREEFDERLEYSLKKSLEREE